MSEPKNNEKCVQCSMLEAENKKLKDEQNLMFLLMEILLGAVKKWGQEHGMIPTDAPDLAEKSSSETMKDDIFAILDALMRN